MSCGRNRAGWYMVRIHRGQRTSGRIIKNYCLFVSNYAIERITSGLVIIMTDALQ